MKKSCDSDYIRLKKKISDLKNKMHISHSRSQFKKLQDELTLAENKLREYQKGVVVVEKAD
jgi:hypothetical protein